MTRPSRLPVQLLAASLLALPLAAQDAPFHANLRDAFQQGGITYSDVWGDGAAGFIGSFGDNDWYVIDASDPDNLSLDTTESVPSPNNTCSAQDVKVGPSAFDPSTTLAFVSFDYNGPDAVGIYDVTNPSSPSLLTTCQPNASIFDTSHNTSYRNDGWLAIANSVTSDVAILDLRSYDPANAPAQINSATYLLSNLGSGLVHDVTFTDDYLLVAEWSTLQVFDARDLGSGPPSYLGQVRGYSCHAVWADDSGTWIVTSEEREGGSIRLWRMTDNGSSVTLDQTHSYVAPMSGTGQAYSAHNPLILGDRIYTSWYGAGVKVHQIDRTDGSLDLVATFDTSSAGAPDGYDGCWGVYPYEGHDNVYASDQDDGFFTIDFSGLEMRSPTARPKTVVPFEATAIQVELDALGNASLSGSVQLVARVNGGSFAGASMSNVGGNLWQGNLPAIGCGDRVDYYFMATAVGGEVFTRPAAAPSDCYTAYGALSLTTVFADDFSTNKGWSVTNTSVSNGGWERGTPVESGLAPGADDPADAGNSCYVTENGLVGSSTSTYDLDGGPTRLFSPILDFSSGDGLISFSAWHANSDADTNDALEVHLSNTGGGGWVQVESIALESGGWQRYCFRISDHLTPTANMQVRFRIADNPNDSVTEAAVDNFLAESFCSANLAGATFRNGSGANDTCFSTTAPVLGQSWSSTVTHSGHPGATLTMLVLYADPSAGTFGPGGEILVDLGSPKYFQSVKAATGSADTHTSMLPPDASFAGRTAEAQGLILGGGYELCNAYHLDVGF